VAEHAVSLLFAMIRQIPQYDKKTKRGYPWGKVEGMNWHITGRTLGLIGYGNVARHVEEMVKGFHMNVIHYDPFTNDSIPLDDVLKLSDYVSLHCPPTPETRGLMNMEKFKLMKRNAILVNTSRGPVINEDDLVAALQNGVIAGAAIDVMVDEPPSDYHPLLKMENVIVTPHIAAFSADFEKNFWEFSVRKLELICEDLDK